jgi:hypothetical protein
MKVTFKVADNRAASPAVNQHQPAAVNSPRRSALLPNNSDNDNDDEDSEDVEEADDADDGDDVGGDVISRSINTNANNAYVRPIEDTRTFRSGLEQLYGGQGERRASASSHRREGGAVKHLPSTHSGGVAQPLPALSLLIIGLLLIQRLHRGHEL